MPVDPTLIADTSALIAYFKDEDGANGLATLISDSRCALGVHVVNVCEVYYNYLRSDGIATAEQVWERVEQMARVLQNIDPQFLKRVGRLKVTHALPLGDAFAAATAEEYGCRLITTDHNHFDTIAGGGALDVLFLR